MKAMYLAAGAFLRYIELPGEDPPLIWLHGWGWKLVPQTGHSMGLENPSGFAGTVAEIVATSWQR